MSEQEKDPNYDVPIPLERNVLKRELFEVTGRDHIKALILNQFLYWSKRVRDYDRLLAEENVRMRQDGNEGNVSPTNGWIYKKAEELAEESMLNLSPQTIGRHIDSLIKQGYLLWRHNPNHKWDRTKQYRVNFRKLQHDLHTLGYPLEGFSFLPNANSKMENANSIIENGYSTMEDQSVKSGRAIPEITTEITYRKKNNDDDNKNTRTQKFMYGSNNERQSNIGMLTDLMVLQVPIENDQVKDFAWEELQDKKHIEPFASLPFSSELEIAVAGEKLSEQEKVGLAPYPFNSPDDPYAKVDMHMSEHLGRVYIAKRDDYLAIKQLLESHVPLEFILAGIDYTFANFGDRKINSFGYCAKVITQQWALEQAKQEDVKPINWVDALPESRLPLQKSSSSTQARYPAQARADKYETFYGLFPD